MTQVLPPKGHKSPQPEDKQSFGYVLWRILGGENASIRVAAGRLGIGPSTLSSILHGRRRISRQTMAEKDWRGVFAAHYAGTWPDQQAAFEQCAAALPERPGIESRQPEDEESFGYVVWRILGGKAANISAAARHLGIHPSALTAILHGRHKISRRALAEKNWRGVFAAYYPGTWSKQQAIFEQRGLWPGKTGPDTGRGADRKDWLR